MRVRKCFRCGKDLDYESYIKNSSPKDINHLTNVWNSDYIELYCCHCYCFKTKYQSNIELEQEFKNLKTN